MTKKFKCSSCNTENPDEFFPNRKTLCKACYNQRQNEDNQKKRELLEKIKAEESKPETPRARSPSPSRENYETFRQAVLDLKALLDNQAKEFQKLTQDFELYKFNSDSKVQALESLIKDQEFLSENVNTYVKNYINSLSLKIQTLESQVQTLESRPLVIPVSTPSSASSSSVSTPETSPAPSPIPIRSKSPVKENPIKAEYQEIIQLIKEDLTLYRKGKRAQNYSLKELEVLTREHQINRHNARNWDQIADIIIAELQNRINVC